MKELLDGLYISEESCNVYIIQDGDSAIAVDFGNGTWIGECSRAGIRSIEHIFLTHHHDDQLSGLHTSNQALKNDAVIHAPDGEIRFLDPDRSADIRRGEYRFGKGCPETYRLPKHPIKGILYDMNPAQDFFWRHRRIRFIRTPGHTQFATTVIVDHHGKQIAFCGDAVFGDGRIWEPWHLEWDHWTGVGAREAWEGIIRLQAAYADWICPSHGDVIRTQVRRTLNLLEKRILKFYRCKGGIAPWEPDRPVPVAGGLWSRIHEHLYRFGSNGYLMISESGETIVIDPYSQDRDAFVQLLADQDLPAPTSATATHYHLDHCDDLLWLRKTYGTRVYLHPSVAAPLVDPMSCIAPWLQPTPIVPDELLPETGKARFAGAEINVYHAPGQTWWHAMFEAKIDGQSVLFSGDTFQPGSRWNGTGGFCAYNRSRFSGYRTTCRAILSLKPDLVAAGHGTIFRYSASRFRKIIRWSRKAERAARAIGHSRNLLESYYHWPTAVVQ